MEKHIYGIKPKRYPRFLKKERSFFRLAAVFTLLIVFAVFRVTAENVPYSGLRFALSEPVSFVQTETDYSFFLEIPHALPSDTDVFFEPLPAYLRFIGFEKKALNQGSALHQGKNLNKGGTRLVYTLRFLKAGNIRLPDLKIRIKGVFYTASFPALTVKENINLIVPEFFFEADTTAYAGRKTQLFLMGRFFSRIEDISWDLPETGLMEKTSASPDLPIERKAGNFDAAADISSDAVKIAEFTYTPFFEGKKTLPKIEVRTQTFGGRTITVRVRDFELYVQPQKSSDKVQARARVVPQNPERTKTTPLPEAQTKTHNALYTDSNMLPADFALRLAQLRVQERRSPVFWLFKKERKMLERSAGLQNADEPSLLWTLVFGLLFFIVSVFLIFAYFKNNGRPRRFGKAAVLCIVVQCVCVFVVIRNLPKLTESAVISERTLLRSIPETDANGAMSLAAGMRLRVLRSSGIWYLVSASEGHSGWILKEECIIIK
ncbi:hypothetical protein H0R92_13405 [Treponema sp. OMZ 840]|uniref:hypothetical protein n=1 Tax=Treponema sp. OMZ 840 TaxID=244313 RepID=UPI003D8BE1E0